MPKQNPQESQSLYGGEVVVSLSTAHRYTVTDNGKKAKARGVTTAIGIMDKPQLIGWAVGEGLDYVYEHYGEPDVWIKAQAASEGKKEEAADIGTQIHDWCEAHIKGLNPLMPDDKNVARGAISFMEWVQSHGIEFEESERFVYSRQHGYVGKFDFTMRTPAGLMMGDLKTGNGLYPPVAMQTAAYARALTEETGTQIVGRWAIRVAKETEAEYNERGRKKNESRVRRGLSPVEIRPYQVFEARFFGNDTLDRDFGAFLRCNELTDWKQAAEKEFKA